MNNNHKTYVVVEQMPKDFELESHISDFLRQKFPQLVRICISNPFRLIINHPCFPSNFIQLSFVERGSHPCCIEIFQRRDPIDVFFIDWVKYEIMCCFNAKYKITSYEEENCSWYFDNNFISVRYYMDYFYKDYRWSNFPETNRIIIAGEVNNKLENIAWDMIHLFGWHHYGLDILYQEVGI